MIRLSWADAWRQDHKVLSAVSLGLSQVLGRCSSLSQWVRQRARNGLRSGHEDGLVEKPVPNTAINTKAASKNQATTQRAHNSNDW